MSTIGTLQLRRQWVRLEKARQKRTSAEADVKAEAARLRTLMKGRGRIDLENGSELVRKEVSVPSREINSYTYETIICRAKED